MTLQVLLQDVLHAPDIGLTVMSISHIANARNSMSFEGQECKIQNKNRNVIGRIPTSMNGLYKVEHKFAGAATTKHVDILTHHKQLSHISADAM
jgi:hypothetical protein